MLPRGSLGVGIGVPGGNIKSVQNFGLFHEEGGYLLRKLQKEPGHGMPPGLLSEVEVKGLHRFFSGLLCGKAGPFVMVALGGFVRELQVSLCLLQPVLGPVHASILRPISV